LANSWSRRGRWYRSSSASPSWGIGWRACRPIRHFREEIPIITRDLDLIDLTGLAMAELRSRVAALPDQTVIIYTTINLDRGRSVVCSG
jgi:hypothetical protein